MRYTAWVEQDYHLSTCPNFRHHLFHPCSMNLFSLKYEEELLVENPERILFWSVTFSGEIVLGLACIVRVISGKGRKKPARHVLQNGSGTLTFDRALGFGSYMP